MYLKELTINGFKSFAKKGDLEFTAPITAIVGPNGSGKSNIAESFRFVLGEQSVKSMRGKRGEDLIWGGSEKVSRGNRASVQLTFDNKSRTFALDFDEVTIERTVHRDGQNEYKLNGSTVRLKDVHELLAGANIGATGHHIISQGEADRVLAAGPKERREMIEDALGLKVYQNKKQETERKLEKTRENISKVESLRREAAPHLKYLQKQVEKAERSLQLQKELRIKYAEYLKREDMYVAHHFDLLNEQRIQPQQRLDDVQEKLAAVKQVLEKAEKKVDTTELDAARAQHRTQSRARQEAERELSRLEGQINFIESRLKHPAQKQVDVSTVVPRAQLEQLVESIAQHAEKALGKGGESVLERALNDLVHQLRMFLKQEQGEIVDTTAADAEELETLRTALAEAQSAVAEAQQAEEAALTAYEKLEQAKADESQMNREAEREMFELMNERRELESTLSNIDRQLAHLERDRNDFKQQLQEAVSLLGRSAADYYQTEVLGDEGATLKKEVIVDESRERQRERKHELEKLKIRLEELGVGTTDELQKEYTAAKERDEFLERELKDLTASVENLKQLIDDMEAKLHEQFAGGLDKIKKEFHTFFTLMFGGGAAGLERVQLKSKGDDETEEVSVNEGVELQVSLPNKRVKGLEMLSGGERALTSIALIFAMSQVNPPPFIILDETDAALDEANSRRYGDMIEALAKRSQLVLITHNRETMSRAGILYGITMGVEGVSKILSVKFEEAAEVAK